jgi:hypothetical protein
MLPATAVRTNRQCGHRVRAWSRASSWLLHKGRLGVGILRQAGVQSSESGVEATELLCTCLNWKCIHRSPHSRYRKPILDPATESDAALYPSSPMPVMLLHCMGSPSWAWSAAVCASEAGGALVVGVYGSSMTVRSTSEGLGRRRCVYL